MSKRGEKKDAWHKNLVRRNANIRRIEVDSIKDSILTARNKLRWSVDSLRVLGHSDLADSARRLAAEVARFEQRVNAALEKGEIPS